MKIILLLVSIYILALGNCFNIQPTVGNAVGYGIGDNRKEAYYNAIQELSTFININVESDIELVNGKLTKDESRLTNNLSISNINIIHQSRENNEWCVVVQYDIRPIDQRIKGLSLKKEVLEENYINGSPMAKRIRNILGFDVNLNLVYDNGWWVVVQDKRVSLHYNEMHAFFYSFDKNPKYYKLHLENAEYHSGEYLNFRLDSEIRNASTIIRIRSDGLGIILDNQWTSSYTSPRSENFQVKNLQKSKSVEILVAIAYSVNYFPQADFVGSNSTPRPEITKDYDYFNINEMFGTFQTRTYSVRRYWIR